MDHEYHLQVVKEVEDLHHFFEEWFLGNVNKDTFTRVEEALSKDFEIISPGGNKSNYDEIIAGIKSNYASTKSMKIWVEDVKTKLIGSNIILCTYFELQTRNDTRTKRYSTALFRISANKPNHVEWIHVHETWIN